MQYLIEPVTNFSQKEMLQFLRKHEEEVLFLLGNFEIHGFKLSKAPNSGNFKLIRFGKDVVGVFCLTRRGNLLIKAPIKDEVFSKVLSACEEETIELTGLIGNWEFWLCLLGISQKEKNYPK